MFRRALSVTRGLSPALLLVASGTVCGVNGPGGSAPNGDLKALGLAYDGPGPGQRVTVKYAGRDYPTFAGQLRMRLLTAPEIRFNSFCVDLLHPIAPGRKYQAHLRGTGTGLRQGQRIAYLYNRYGQSESLGAVEAAALQLAIWDEVIDDGDGLDRGTFRYPASNALARRALQFVDEARERAEEAKWLDARANGPDSDPKRGQSVLAPASLQGPPREESQPAGPAAPADIVPTGADSPASPAGAGADSPEAPGVTGDSGLSGSASDLLGGRPPLDAWFPAPGPGVFGSRRGPFGTGPGGRSFRGRAVPV